MPVSFLGEFGLYVMINQVRKWNALLWLAIALLVHLHSETVYGRLGQVLRRVLFDCSDDSGPTHSPSRCTVFAP
jgi:hypothetical protein